MSESATKNDTPGPQDGVVSAADWSDLQQWLIPRGQAGRGKTLLATFGVEWCDQCGMMIRCPRCGNNSCNGGRGEMDHTGGGTCPVCNIAYELMRIISDAASVNGIGLSPAMPVESR